MDSGIIAALATLEAEPDNAEALAQLKALTGNGHGKEQAQDPALQRALAEARRIHRERGDYELCLQLLDLELGFAAGDARKADLLFEKGKLLADELLLEKEAIACFERVLELRPDDETTQDTLGHIGLVRDNWQKIVKKYLEEARDSTDRQLTTSLYLSVAEIYAKYQPDDHVEAFLQQALEVEPRNAKASLRLERLYRAAGRHEELAALLEARIEAASTKEERVQGYLALAEVQAEKLGKRDAAAESYKKALGIDPGSQRALRALVAYYTGVENWQALIRVYENALRARPRGESETAMYLQIGMLWWKKLGNLEAADDYWKRVRKAEPAHPAMIEFYRELYAKEPGKLVQVLGQAQKVEKDARRRLELAVELAQLAERASGGVEKAIDLWKAVLKLDAQNAEATAALRRLYEQTEKWNALLELLKERVEAVPKEDVEERVARLLEIVAIYRDKLNLDVMVINTYNNILQLKPDHDGALKALAEKYEAMGRWNDLIGVLQRRADVTTEPPLKAQLLRRISGLWIDKFTNFNQAVRPLEELYALEPGDPDTIARLRDIYTRRRSWRALVDLERKDLERLEGARRREKIIEIARLAADRLGDAKEAIALWNELLRADPNDAEALVALQALYEREKRWPALIEVLRRQADQSPEVKAQVVFLERIGALWAERLQAPDQAIRAYQEIVRRMPSHPKAMRTLRELFAQLGRFDELERLYGEQGQWEELCEVLQSVAERLPDLAQRLGLYTRVAEVAARELRSPERAAKAYERILAIDGENAEAAARLVPIYRGQEKWPRLLATYEILLKHAADDDAKLGVLAEIRALCEEKLGSKGLAFSWCARAYTIRPEDAALEKTLERLAAEAEAWEELAELYAGQVTREADPERRAERHRKLGRIALNRLRRPEDARRHFEAVLEHQPEDDEALSTLEQIFTQAQSYPELLAVYRRREGRERDPQRRLEVLFKIAWIEEAQLAEAPAAVKTYQRILEADPPGAVKLRALRALEKLHLAAGAWEALAGVLEQQLELQSGEDPETRVGLALQLGELYETQLQRGKDALRHYRAAFQLRPSHAQPVAALERWLAGDAAAERADRVEVAKLLLPVYEQRDDAAKLVACLEVLLEAAPEDDAARLELLRRLVGLVGDRLGDARKAYGYTASVFALRPADAENRRRMAQYADALDCPDDLAVRLGEAEKVAADRGDLGLATALAWDLGQLFDARLQMPDEAEKAYRRVLEREPEHGEASVALVQLYSVNERWSDLRALLEQKKARALDTQSRMHILFQISDLDEGVLGNEEAAERDYREILELDPGSDRAFRALDRLLSSREKWTDLAELLERRTAYARQDPEVMGTPDSRAHIKFRRGELCTTRLEQHDQAARLFEDALADEPRHEGARRGLEQLMKRPELRQRIARVLEPFYVADEAWAKLALALGAQRENPELKGAEAAGLAVRLAELQEEKLGARQLALQTWREALRLDPADKRVRDNVERLATLLGRLPELAQAWEEAILATDPADLFLRGELLEKVAELYEFELNENERARGAWKRLLELDPSNLHTSRPAAAALARLYEAQENWPELIGILRRQAEWATVAQERKELLYRIGRIQEDLLADPLSAIGTWREVLEGDPEDGVALDALERLYLSQGDYAGLIEILTRRLELTADPQARRDLHWRIAGLTERELKDPADAIATYHALLDERPDDQPALEALARLYEQAQRPADLLEILEKQLALAQKPAQRIALRMRIAGLLEGFRRLDQALERYREVLEEDAAHAGARAGLEKLLDDEDLRLRAAEVLEPHYQRAGEIDKLVRIAELWAEHAPDPRERIARLGHIAELREQGAEAGGAFDALARAARVAVGEPDLPSILDRLEKAAAQAGLRAELVALYRELGPDILDAATQERVYLAVAAESHKLGDRETAREYYRRVLDTAPDHPRALDALENLYLEGQEWEPLFEIYVRRADLALDDDDRRRHYLMQLAAISEGSLDRPGEAVRAYEQVLELFPADVEASRALEQHYEAMHRHADLAELLEGRLNFTDDLDEAVALRYRLAQIYDEDLSDSDRAVDNYRAALGGDPTHAGAIAALERFLDHDQHRVAAAEVLEPVYVARHDWPKLVRIYQIRLEAAEDPAIRLALVRRIAHLHEEQLEDLDGAFTWFGKVFREDPQDRGTRDQLARLAGILDGWAKLARVYEDWLADVAGEEDETAVDVLRTLAGLYHIRLNDVDGAKGCYERLLAIDAGDDSAFQNLESLLLRARRFDDLLTLWREAADAALDLERKKTLLFKQAQVQETELGDAAAAIELYRAVMDVDPEEARAIAALDRLYTAGKRWHDLVELLERRLAAADDRGDVPAWVQLKLRLGGLYESELEDRTSAIDAYEQALGRAPGDAEAVRALEQLIVDNEHTFRIAQILEPIYRDTDAWQKLIVIYDAELEFIDERARRVELLREIARLHEQRGGEGRLAFGALARAWTEEVEEGGGDGEQAIYDEMERLARELVMWRELVHTLEGVVEKSYEPDLQAVVYARVARLKEQRLADLAGAIESWRKVTVVHDEDDEAWQALERLYEQKGPARELVAVLDKRATLSPDPEEQKALLFRAATLYEEALAQPEQAIATYQKILAVDETELRALDALDRLFEERGLHRELASVLQRRVELTDDPATRRTLRFRLAKVQERELHDVFGAVDTYKAALGDEPQDKEALVEVARLYAGEGLWADHLEALDALIALEAEPARTDLEFKAAQVLEKEVGDAEGAIARYRGVLLAQPLEPGAAYHAGARTALERLLRDEATRAQAAEVLEPFYVARGEHGALVELCELKAAEEVDPAERRALYQRIAELQETGLEDLQAAFATWGRVLAEEPGDEEAQAQLERLSEKQGAPAELARLYEERLQAAFDPEVQRVLAWKLGVLYEGKLGDEERAAAAYSRALELSAGAPEGAERACLEALDRLLFKAGRFADLGEVLEKEALLEADPDKQAELYHRLGALRADELVDLDGALVAFREALERKPDHAEARAGLEKLLGSQAHAEAALDLLEPLYDADGNHEKWVELAEVRLGVTDGRADKAQLLERIAERCEHQLGDAVRALSAIARALELDPQEPRLADEVERLAEQAGASQLAGEIFERIIEGGVEPMVGRELGLRAARLWERSGDDRAEARYHGVLALDEACTEALEALDRIYRVRGDALRLADVLERRAAQELDLQLKRQHLVEAARLKQSAAEGPADEVVAAWRTVLDADEAEPTALDALAGLYEARGEWQALVETLEQKARFTEQPPAQVGLKGRIAAIYAERLGDLEQAVRAYRDLLDLQPDALSALESLEDLERRRGDHTAVQEVLVRRLQAVGSGAPQIPVYRKLAELAVEGSAPDDAVGYLHEILAIAPDEPWAQGELVRLLEEAGKHHDLIDVLTEQANRKAQAGDQAGEVRLLVRVADLWEEKLGSPESATEILERILERDPNNVRALGSLARIYEGQQELDKCRATLEKAIALAQTGEEQAELHFRLGRLEADAGGEEAAEPHWLRALDADPSHQAALAALEKVARARGDFGRVADLLELREAHADDETRRGLWLELAQVLTEKLDQPKRALPYLERAVQIQPDEPTVLEPLADLYFAADRLDEALPLYQTLAERMQKARRMKDVGRLRYRMGAIAEKRGDVKTALEAYAQAHQIDPTHARTMSALGRLYLAQAEWEKARGIFRKMLLQNLDPSAGVSKADVYLHLGEIHEKLGEGPKAVGMYERGLELDAGHTGLRAALERVKRA